MRVHFVRAVAAAVAAGWLYACVVAAGPKAGDTFASPLHNFRVTVPNLPLGVKIEKSNDDFHGFVAFNGGAGDVCRIGYQKLAPPPAAPADSMAAWARMALAGLDSLALAILRTSIAGLDASGRDVLLGRIEQQLPGMSIGAARQHPPIPDSTILEFAALAYVNLASIQGQLMRRFNANALSREPMIVDSTLMILTIAVSSEASGSVNMATGKQFDRVFGHMVFLREGFVYNLNVSPGGFSATQSQAELAQNNRRRVVAFYRNMAIQ